MFGGNMKSLFATHFYESYQCDKSRSFYVDFNHKMVKFSFCQLLALRQQVNKFDPETHFNGQNKHGLEILILCNRNHIFILDTIQLLDLQQLIKGTFYSLELNSLIASSS